VMDSTKQFARSLIAGEVPLRLRGSG